MPTGPQGQRRPADPARNTLKILKIATGEIEEKLEELSAETKHARTGGHARAKHLTKAQRSAIARKAARARWHKVDTTPQQ